MRTIKATYNNADDTCDVYVFSGRNGTWYVCDGGTIVNCTYDELFDGMDLGDVHDVDCFTWSSPIESEEELIKAIEA